MKPSGLRAGYVTAVTVATGMATICAEPKETPSPTVLRQRSCKLPPPAGTTVVPTSEIVASP